ncbi:MAG: hypothetical protein SGJ18_11150 [Pseudomonadota bacterium]|nr:hypothetical protein [Pseudomonadota bacterium]
MDTNCKKCGAEVKTYLQNHDLPLCFACVTKRSGRSSRMRRLMSVETVDVGPGGSCIFCRQTFENNRIGIFLSDGKVCEGCALEVQQHSGKSFAKILESLPKEWLVKSSGRVFGPFSQKEVDDRLMDRVIVPLDEVGRPFERWKYIRDEVIFSKTVDTLRISGAGAREDTSTNTILEQTETSSMTPFEEGTAMMDITSRVQQVDRPDADQKSFGLIEVASPATKQTLSSGFHFNWYYPLLALVIVAFLWVYILNKNKMRNSFEESYRSGLEAAEIGDYPLALNHFTKANSMRPQDVEVRLQLAPLLIVYEQEYVKAVRLLEGIVESERGDEYRLETYDILGLASIYQEQATKAAEYFDLALMSDKSYSPALINKAILKINDKKYQEAIEILKDENSYRSYGALRSLLLGIATIQEGLKSVDLNYFKRAQVVIKQHLANSDEYRQEALLLNAYIQSRLKSKEMGIYELLDFDPEQSSQYLTDLLTFRQPVEWAALFSYCKEIFETTEKTTESTALMGYCHMKINQMEDAKKYFEVALSRDPNDSLVGALRGYFLLTRGRADEAKEEINLAIRNQSSFKLPYLLKARYCYQTSEYQCAKEHWQNLAKKYPNDVSVLAGLSQTLLTMGNKKEARVWLEKGLKRTRSHRQLLRLARELKYAERQ